MRIYVYRFYIMTVLSAVILSTGYFYILSPTVLLLTRLKKEEVQFIQRHSMMYALKNQTITTSDCVKSYQWSDSAPVLPDKKDSVLYMLDFVTYLKSYQFHVQDIRLLSPQNGASGALSFAVILKGKVTSFFTFLSHASHHFYPFLIDDFSLQTILNDELLIHMKVVLFNRESYGMRTTSLPFQNTHYTFSRYDDAYPFCPNTGFTMG
jgi:hypothetical protein